MPSNRFGRMAAFVAAAAIALGACGGGAGPASDPTGSVTNAFAAITSGGIGKVTEFACAAHKDDIAGAFGAGSASALQAAGVKAEDVYNAMSISFSNVSAKEVSKTGTAAVVHVTADMKIAFDREKFKALMKTVLAAQGQPADDATLDRLLTAMSGQLEQTQHLDEDIDVVNEGGKWLLCE